MNDVSAPVYCSNHPNVETSLRCNRCEKPICPKCAISTPTGYRCSDCVRDQQKKFDTALWQDYLIGGFVSGGLALLGSYIVPSFGFFTIFLAPIVGVIIVEIARTITRKRRSKRLFQIISLCTVIGCLPVLLISLITFALLAFQGNISSIWSLIWKIIYAFTVSTTVYYRFSGIRINV